MTNLDSVLKSRDIHFANKGQYSQSYGVSQVALLVKNLLTNAGALRDVGSIPGLGRCPEEGNGTLVQYSCLENPMDREAWKATVHWVSESQTRLK